MDRSNIIPEKELVSILTDIHIADGLLTMPKIHQWFSSLDTTSTYNHIIEKHGYSKETMDKTMKYYFIRNPKKLINIYDQVLGILSEMESRVVKELVLEEARTSNLWTGKEFYSFPDPSGTDSVIVDIPLIKPGIYTFAFSVTLFPDDQSANSRVTAYLCNSDSLETGKRDYIKTLNYIKDGQPHTYTLKVKVQKLRKLRLRGCLYDFDNFPEEWGKHVIIENISITYSPVAL